jgi:hypothetical protein
MSTDGTIPFDEVVRLIVERDSQPYDTPKSAKERAVKRLRYAIKNPTIKGEGGAEKIRILERSGGLLSAHVFLWLKQKYPGRFDDLPDVSYGDICLPIRVTVTAPPPNRPENVEQAFAKILAMHEEIQQLKAHIREIEPDAMARKLNREKNRASASKPRPRDKFQ